MTSTQDALGSSKAQLDETLQRFANGFSWVRRAPVLHSPSEHGLEYEDVTFPARDGVPLEGWFIAAPGSSKLIVANHPMGFSRSGMPADVQPWHADWAPSGNGFEVDLVPDYKILHDAGYNVLAYDLRNHGLSGAANGGVVSGGIFESRDVLGSLRYVRGEGQGPGRLRRRALPGRTSAGHHEDDRRTTPRDGGRSGRPNRRSRTAACLAHE